MDVRLIDKLEEIDDDNEQLKEVDKELSLGRGPSRAPTRTREKLREAERLLASRGETTKTSTRTKQKLEAANAKLAEYSTSTRTREKLIEAERQIAATSTRTKERLKAANEELARIKTTTRTREQLCQVEKEIKSIRRKETSSYTMEIFKKKQELLANLLDQNKNADIAFLVDCTGSMGGYLDQTKNNINKIVSEITGIYHNQLRIAFVGYRDHSDGAKRIESLGFTENIEEFKLFVSNIAAAGGDDTPEDVLGGLEAVINLAWSSASKVIFHVGDAPQHGERFHDMGPHGDSYYSGDPRGLHPEDLFKSMKQIGLRYFFGKVNNSTDKMFNVFQSLGGKEMVNPVDMSNPNLLETRAMTSITATIEETLSRAVDFGRALRVHGPNMTAASEVSDGGKTLKDYSISDVEPDHVELTSLQKVHWLNCLIGKLDNISDIKHHIGTINHAWSTEMLKKAKQPFAEGAQRISYHGQKMSYIEGADNAQIVIKEFKFIDSGRDRRADYIEIMETQCVAAFMAMEFNKLAPIGSKRINFISVSVAQVFDNTGVPKYYNVEPLLPEYTNFKKWNTNYGSVIIDDHLIQAFSHWTHNITNGFLVVVDLQSIDRKTEYGLTDPCINCKEPRFGSTNMGEVGIEQFFRTHKCNFVCRSMGLREITLYRRAKRAVFGK